jgi:hypothetical protein
MSVDKFGRMSFHPLSKYRRISGDVFDIQNKKIINVESPNSEKDAVNKIYLDTRLESIKNKFETMYEKQELLTKNIFDDLISRIDKCIEVIKGGIQLEHLRAYFESELNLEKNRLINLLSNAITLRNEEKSLDVNLSATDQGVLSKAELIKFFKNGRNHFQANTRC